MAKPAVNARGKLERLSRAFRMLFCGALLAPIALWLCADVSFAQSRQIRLVVPFAPGGGVDGAARIVAAGLAAHLGRTVIVENRPGASTLTAAEMVARSEPDGDTLLFTVDETFTVIPLLSKHLSIQPSKELVPINLVGKILMIVLTNPSVPVSTLPELINYARTNPKGVNYASTGPGSALHLSMEMLKHVANVQMLHVPYRGTAPALTAVAAGDVQVSQAGYATAGGLIDAGKLKPIAIASPERVAALPNVPTTHELGYGKVDSTTWLGIAAPVRTPPETVDRINQAISAVLKNPEVRKQLVETRHFVISDVGPSEFARQMQERFQLNAEAVKIAGAVEQQ
jgi:tripartite-type tricarboxylate transporter receptor subunit TctC